MKFHQKLDKGGCGFGGMAPSRHFSSGRLVEKSSFWGSVVLTLWFHNMFSKSGASAGVSRCYTLFLLLRRWLLSNISEDLVGILLTIRPSYESSQGDLGHWKSQLSCSSENSKTFHIDCDVDSDTWRDI
jgi:hypothetical protein